MKTVITSVIFVSVKRSSTPSLKTGLAALCSREARQTFTGSHKMRFCTLLLVAVAAVVSRRCVTHREADALLRDHQLEGELTDQQIRAIRTGAIYTKLVRRGSGAAEALDTALLRSNKIIVPSTFRRYTQYASTPRQVQADAVAWIESRATAKGWGKLSTKQAYDCYITRHSHAGGDSTDLWQCVCDKLLQCAFQDRLQQGRCCGVD